jgi:hypothetical protein
LAGRNLVLGINYYYEVLALSKTWSFLSNKDISGNDFEFLSMILSKMTGNVCMVIEQL